MNEALEKLEGEEHNVTVMDTKITEAEQKIDELNNKTEEMSENIARVCEELSSFFYCSYLYNYEQL